MTFLLVGSPDELLVSIFLLDDDGDIQTGTVQPWGEDLIVIVALLSSRPMLDLFGGWSSEWQVLVAGAELT